MDRLYMFVFGFYFAGLSVCVMLLIATIMVPVDQIESGRLVILLETGKWITSFGIVLFSILIIREYSWVKDMKKLEGAN